jgi:hypothetical protein
MLSDAQKQILISASCIGALIFLAFFGAYAGRTFSEPPILRIVEIPQPSQNKPRSATDTTDAGQRGTENSPLIVKILPAPKTPEESANDLYDRNEKTSSDRWLIGLTGVLALVGGLQLITFGVQAHRLKQTVDAMQGQSTDMKLSISESTRAANAMELVAAHLRVNVDKITETVEINKDIANRQREFGELQLRAIVGVRIGPATYQDEKYVFASGPVFVNTGHTAARRFRYAIKADILPVPLPDDYKFRLPPRTKASALLPPQEPRDGYTMVDHRVPDEDVSRIKRGIKESLYVWGTAAYEDAFGRTKRLTFLQQITWIGDGESERVRGLFPNRHNQSN